MTHAQQIALWADRLREIAAQGLSYAQDIYDRERYGAVQDVAMALLALATGETLADMEPLRAPVFSRFTPLMGGDGAVIDDDGRILLIRRADNGKWAMPGGALEVGETPAEGVVREVLEETGVRCRPVALAGIFDSRRFGAATRHHFYLVTFLCRPVEGAVVLPPSHANEVLDIGWFPEAGLPEEMHPGSASRLQEALRVWRNGSRAFFDGLPERGDGMP